MKDAEPRAHEVVSEGTNRLWVRRASIVVVLGPMRFSGGVAVLEGDATLDQMMAIADAPLYTEKAAHGRAERDERRQ